MASSDDRPITARSGFDAADGLRLPVPGDHSEVWRIAGVAALPTDAFLSRLDGRLRAISDADAIIDEAIAAVGCHLDVMHCRFGEKDRSHARRIRRAWHRAGAPQIPEAHHFRDYLAPAARAALAAGAPVVIEDLGRDPRSAAHAEVFAALGVGAYLSVPYVRESECQARLAILSATPRKWRDDEVQLVRRVLNRVWPLAANARARFALEESERRERERASVLETVLEAIPVPVLIAHDADCRRITGNRALKQLLRLKPGETCLSAPPEEQPTHYRICIGARELALEELPLQQAARGITVKDLEVDVLFSSGEKMHFIVNAVPLRDERHRVRGAVATLVDITERLRTGHAMAQLAAVLQAGGDAIISRGLDRTILSWNPAAERLFGWPAAEAIGQSIRITTLPHTWGSRDLLLERVKNGEMIGSLETERIRRDGSRFFGEVTYSPVKDSHGNVISIVTVVRDTTVRRQAEEALGDYAKRLEALSKQLVDVQERERATLSRELHDQIGQILGAAKLRLRIIRRHVAAQAVQQALDEIGEALGEALQKTRSLALSLRPPQLDDLGLAPALHLYAKRLIAASSTTLHFSAAPLPPVPPPLDIACFRIAQEALQNVLRHASAHNVWVELCAQDGALRLAVRDDGTGCDLAAVRTRARHGESMGLINMEERAALAGGTMEFLSLPGDGTTIRALFPLRVPGSTPAA